jgi:hypothetical protein
MTPKYNSNDFMVAVEKNNINLVNKLLENNVDYNYGFCLRHAAEFGYFDILKKLLENKNNIVCNFVQEAFTLATINGYLHIFEFFINEFGIDYQKETNSLIKKAIINKKFNNLKNKPLNNKMYDEIINFLWLNNTSKLLFKEEHEEMFNTLTANEIKNKLEKF